MKAGVIAGLALLWRLLVWIWSILIVGVIIGILGNATYTYLTTSKLDVTDPRTLPLLQWARTHLLLLVLILLDVLVLTLCAWLANRYQKKVMREDPHPQKEAEYESRFEAPSQGVVIGEHNTVTIYGQIPPDQHRPQEPALPRWNVPYRRNPFFTGREELLKHLHDNLTNRKAAVLTQAISGLGGIGKTQTAVEYACRYRDEYHDVLWVNAATRDTLIASFVDLARLLSLPEKNERDQNITVQAVKRWLEQHEHWLLIVDNADDLALSEEFLPTGGKGHILLTTRAQAPGTLANGIDVEEMDREEGMLLLLRSAKVLARDAPLAQASETDRVAAQTIVKEMDGLPLALDQAGAYIEETHCSVSAYLVSYHHRQAELLKRRGGTGQEYPKTIATTWSLSFERVEQLSPMAADLLRVCAFLTPDAIPIEMIAAGAGQLGPLLHPVATDPSLLDEPIAILRRYSLVRRNSEDNTLSMHRLVQTIVKANIPSKTRLLHRLIQTMLKKGMTTTQREWAEKVVQAVNEAFPFVEIDTWPQCQRYLPHALACADLISQYTLVSPQAARLLNQTASYLHGHALYAQAEPLYERVLAIREKQLGPDHLGMVEVLSCLSNVYSELGQYEKAKERCERSLSIFKQHLKSDTHLHSDSYDHLDMASLLNNLAILSKVRGRPDQAEQWYLRCLYIRAQSLAPDHLDMGSPYFDMASLLKSLTTLSKVQGKLDEAEERYIRCLQNKKTAVLKFAQSLNNLAVLYAEQCNKYETAEWLFRCSLSIQEQSLERDDRDYALSLNNLANLYTQWGSKYVKAQSSNQCERCEMAKSLYRKSQRILEQCLGDKHPDLAYPLHGLGILHFEQGKQAEAQSSSQQALYQKAESLYQCSKGIWEQRLVANHPQVAYSLHNLAVLYTEQGKYAKAEERDRKYEEAEKLFTRSLCIWKQILEPEHLHTRTCAKNYAILLHILKRDAEALELARKYNFFDERLDEDELVVLSTFRSFRLFVIF